MLAAASVFVSLRLCVMATEKDDRVTAVARAGRWRANQDIRMAVGSLVSWILARLASSAWSANPTMATKFGQQASRLTVVFPFFATGVLRPWISYSCVYQISFK